MCVSRAGLLFVLQALSTSGMQLSDWMHVFSSAAGNGGGGGGYHFAQQRQPASPIGQLLGQVMGNVIKSDPVVHKQHSLPKQHPLERWVSFLNVRPSQPSPQAASVQQSSLQEQLRQGLGLVNAITNIRRDPLAQSSPHRSHANQLLGHARFSGLRGVNGVEDRVGLPTMQFLQGVPVVPGIAGSLPGAGECLPNGTPLVPGHSPNMFQNFLKDIPGAQDVLRSLQPKPRVDVQRLMGNWHWVLTSNSQNDRYCATSEYKKVVLSGDNASFSILDKFKEGGAGGTPKIGIGYGLKNGHKTSIYTQSDPCPYEVVMVGPASTAGQYEFIILSNWAKYPVIGLARDVRLFNRVYKKHMDKVLREHGYMSILTDMMGTFHHFDWSHCQAAAANPGNVVGNLLNNILFG